MTIDDKIGDRISRDVDTAEEKLRKDLKAKEKATYCFMVGVAAITGGVVMEGDMATYTQCIGLGLSLGGLAGYLGYRIKNR